MPFRRVPDAVTGGRRRRLVHPRPPAVAAPLLADQSLGASIAWAFAEIPAAIVMIILVIQWIRADEREQRRLDPAAD
jgi:cytochrome c oxidase assembly factor CtaG